MYMYSLSLFTGNILRYRSLIIVSLSGEAGYGLTRHRHNTDYPDSARHNISRKHVCK